MLLLFGPCSAYYLSRARSFQMQNSSTSASGAGGSNSQNNTLTFQIPPLLNLHFDELKKEMSQFGQVFNDWVGDKRRILTDDKENFLKTLAEEAGKRREYNTFVFLIADAPSPFLNSFRCC